MNRAIMQGATLAFLGVTIACSGGNKMETGMAKTDAAVASLPAGPPGSLVTADSGQGSGGHLKLSGVICHVDATTGILVCSFAADSGMGSGGHYPVRAALLMGCSSNAPAKEVVCTAPLGARQ